MAHRFGDRYVIDGKDEYLILMENCYNKAYEYALKCKSKKHLMNIQAGGKKPMLTNMTSLKWLGVLP